MVGGGACSACCPQRSPMLLLCQRLEVKGAQKRKGKKKQLISTSKHVPGAAVVVVVEVEVERGRRKTESWSKLVRLQLCLYVYLIEPSPESFFARVLPSHLSRQTVQNQQWKAPALILPSAFQKKSLFPLYPPRSHSTNTSAIVSFSACLRRLLACARARQHQP